VRDKLFIYLLLNISHKIFSFINHVLEKNNPTNHHQNVIQFNKIQKKKKFKLMYIFGRKIYLIIYVIESTLIINFKIFNLDKY
jgi:hypothetical protein